MMKRRRESFGRDPFDLQREIDRLFAELLGSPRRKRREQSAGSSDPPGEPSVEFLEQEDAYLIGLEVPDYQRNELEVLVEGKRLTVRGRQESPTPRETFRHRFDLGREVPPEEVDAAFRNGILVIRVAKPPEADVRTIEVT